MAFCGPYAIEIRGISEKPPHTTGELTLAVISLGLPKAALATLDDMFECLSLDAIHDAAGNELRRAPDTRWMSTPTVQGGLTFNEFKFDLCGLLQNVERIEKVREKVHLKLPEWVDEISLDPFAKGPYQQDHWRLSTKWSQTQTEIKLETRDRELTEATARYFPRDEHGQRIVMEYSSASPYSNTLHAGFQTETRPTHLSIKVAALKTASFDFTLENIPLSRFAEQPVQLETLTFEGPTPMTAEFARFVDRNDPNFVKIEMNLTNRSNKAIETATVDFEYLDRAGKRLASHPHVLQGRFGSDNAPLLSVQETKAQEETAFFMPEDTVEVRLTIKEVGFADGSTWESPATK